MFHLTFWYFLFHACMQTYACRSGRCGDAQAMPDWRQLHAKVPHCEGDITAGGFPPLAGEAFAGGQLLNPAE